MKGFPTAAYVVWRVIVQCASVGLLLVVLSRVQGFFETCIVSGVVLILTRMVKISHGAGLLYSDLLLRLKAAGLALAREGEDLDSVLAKDFAVSWVDLVGGWALQAIAVVAVVRAWLS